MTTNVIDVGEAEFSTKVVEASKTAPVVVDFWASWCQPCKTLSPILERAAADGEGAFTLAKVDVDANQRLAQAFSIQSIPTVIAFRDGRPVDMFTGALPEAQVKAFISRLVPPAVDERVVAAEGLIEAGKVAEAESSLRALLDENPANTAPVGTGPFKFAEHKAGEYYRLEKNADYWGEGLPNLDEIVYRVLPDVVPRVSLLTRKTVNQLESFGRFRDELVKETARHFAKARAN